MSLQTYSPTAYHTLLRHPSHTNSRSLHCCRLLLGLCLLQVGYVTPDLFTHSVSYFAEAPLSHHNKQRVQMYIYSCVAKPDAKTARLRQQVAAVGGVWRDVARLAEPQLAQVIRQDEVDILVELTGRFGTLE